ncbi:MAG TPA: hypothetical protein VE970_11785, partial [Pseudolabrys sp.]|nr:hypothetical protein [Pseudolabrys sp.]
QSVPTNESTNMLEPDQWDSVLGRITGTIYRGTERISTAAILNALGVSQDRRERQIAGKRKPQELQPSSVPRVFPELRAPV